MVGLNSADLNDLEGAVRGLNTVPDGLRVLQFTIEPGSVEDDIQDVRVYVTVDVSEADGWRVEQARSLRGHIQAAVTNLLRARNDDSAFSVTTYLRPRDASVDAE